MRARVIGLGQAAAGDDGVGLVVLQSLRQLGLPGDVELHDVAEATAVVALLETDATVIVVDAIAGGQVPGEVLELSPDDIEARGLTPLSTHGISLSRAIDLARLLSRDWVPQRILIVGVTIHPPTRYRRELSPAVARAVPRAVAAVLGLLEASRA